MRDSNIFMKLTSDIKLMSNRIYDESCASITMVNTGGCVFVFEMVSLCIFDQEC